jgi:hypothetical protein
VDGDEGVEVGVPAATEGVTLLFGAGVGDGTRPGMVRVCPSASELGSAILFERTISSTVTPNISAMPERVSPDFTLYVTGGTVGRACGVGVGDATGVTTSLIGSTVPLAPPHAASSKQASKAEAAAISLIETLFCARNWVATCNAAMTYGFLVVMPVLGMVGSVGSEPPASGCEPVPGSAPVEGAPGADGGAGDPPEPGR